jgi:hypothetical protein
MKRILSSIPMLICIVSLFSACSTSSLTQTSRLPNIKKEKETAAACFIVKKDGTVQNFASLKLVTGMFTSPHLLADGKIRITGEEIKAYQNQEQYAISQEYFESGHKSRVAIEALPGFAVRIAKGSLNIYCKKYFNGAKAIDELFVQSGEEGKILPYSSELVASIVKDHQNILDILNNDEKNVSLAKKLQTVAEVYNQEHLISKN